MPVSVCAMTERVYSKIYDKWDDFYFSIVNCSFLPRAQSYGLYLSQLIRFSMACSSYGDINSRNLILTEKLLKQGYRFHQLRKAFYRMYRNLQLTSKYNCNLKTLM